MAKVGDMRKKKSLLVYGMIIQVNKIVIHNDTNILKL